MNGVLPSSTAKKGLNGHIRIIWALFSKDVLEALKNKNTIVVIITSLLMVLFYSALPALEGLDESSNVLLYDASGSELASRLKTNQAIRVYTYPSEAAMKELLTEGTVPELGLVVPENFSDAIQPGETIQLQGYVMRWVNDEDAESLRTKAEREISAALGKPVTVTLADPVELLPNSGGLGETAGFGLVFVVVMIGVILIPHLMLDEKQNRTLEALAVSPASAGHIAIGKALAGLFYCLLGGLVAIAINQALIIHWWLAILALLLGSLFTVTLGLWLGIKIDTRAQLAVWSWVVLLPLIFPLIFSLLGDLVPAPLYQASKVIPSVVTFDLFRYSFAGAIPAGKTILMCGWLVLAVVLGLALDTWTLKRLNRETGSSSPARRAFASVTGGENCNTFSSLQEKLPRLRLPERSTGKRAYVTADTAGDVPRKIGALGMIRVVAAKDLVEAVKNRLIVSILVGCTFILLSGAALPLLLTAQNTPRLVVLDQGNSAVIQQMAEAEGYRVTVVSSTDELNAYITGTTDLTLGTILPENFDLQASSGEPVELQALYPHWARTDQVVERSDFFASLLSQASAAPIQLNPAGTPTYPQGDLNGRSSMLLMNLIAVILVVGAALVPLLIIEEKEAQTIKVLMVSPASLGQVVVGKALVGLFFSLLPATLVMILNQRLFVHWDIAILALLLTALVATSIGLLIGLYADSPTTATLWGSLTLLLLLGTAVFKVFPGINLPASIAPAERWFPGSAMMELFSLSQLGSFTVSQLWMNVTALLAVLALVFAILIWRLHRMERQ